MNPSPREELVERDAFYLSGWLALALWLGTLAALVWFSLGSLLNYGTPPLKLIVGIPFLVLLGKGFVILSDADRVKLVTNLLTVLVSETETQPVLSVSRD